MNLVAEDGVRMTYQKSLTAFELGAAQTVDALMPSAAKGNYPLYDAMLNMSNKGQSPGGSLAYLGVGADVVTITRAYRAGNGNFAVWANSSGQPTAVLTAVGLGKLFWNSTQQRYYGSFAVPIPPSVTVTSNLGGTDTESVPFP
jgi:hypothetical protein